jgi:hypothetical protein
MGGEQRMQEVVARIDTLRADLDRERDLRTKAELRATQLQADLARTADAVLGTRVGTRAQERWRAPAIS